MKKLFIIMIFVFLMVFSSCKYNGEATLIVKNVGPLVVVVEVEYSRAQLGPGEEIEFTLTWPGHDDMHTNVNAYALAYKETLWESFSIWIKDNETVLQEVAFYPPELTR